MFLKILFLHNNTSLQNFRFEGKHTFLTSYSKIVHFMVNFGIMIYGRVAYEL